MDITQTKAIVLAAGLGKRMRPLTDTMPKPLVKVGGKCLIDHALDFLQSAGVAEAVVNTHYFAPMLEAHLRTRTVPKICISHEDILLETGGGILHALPMLGDGAFFAINSDTICLNGQKQHALQRMAALWDDTALDALLLLHPVEEAVGYGGAGDFLLGDGGELIRRTGDTAPYVFTGIQILHPRLFGHAPVGAFSLNVLYNHLMQDRAHKPRIRALVHDGKWLHVGDPSAIALAEAQL